jgi:tripartite-type tricarboxylate transporter receptor subunit TctC
MRRAHECLLFGEFQMSIISRAGLGFTILVMALCGNPLTVQAYPDGPVRIVVPFPPGGTSDVLARLISRRLEERLGKPFVIENKSGAGGMIGATAVAQSAPDGNTILLGTIATHGINNSVYKKMPYDAVRDFEPITVLASPPNVLMVHPSLPVKSVAELIDYAKQNPGILNFGSTGIGGSPHMSGELLKAATGIDMKHIPYRGSAPMMTDLLGGHIKVAFDNLPTSLEHIRSGAVRALAVTSVKRFSGVPDVPAMAETIPGYEVIAWYGFLCPANTPRPVIDLLYRNIADILKEEEIRERLEEMAAVPGGNTPQEFAKQIELEIKKWKGVVDANGITKVE